jgi:hypothetical protein
MNKSVISTQKIQSILEGKYGYKCNQAMYQMFGEFIWFPSEQPLDLSLVSKSIKMSELSTIFTEKQLVNLIESKLNQ